MPKQFVDYEVYIVYVDDLNCDGCKACLEMCPCDVFHFLIKVAVPVNSKCCLGCRTCEAVCKSRAVMVTEI